LITWANKATSDDPSFGFSFTVSDWASKEAQDVMFLAKGYIPGGH
jgi:hypothetical protein